MNRRLFTIAFALVLPFSAAAQGLQLLTPEPGATVASGQVVAVTWSASSAIENVTLSYCWDDSMKYWESMTYAIPNNGSFSWRVPYFKTTKSKVYIKIAAEGINVADTINSPVTISAMTPDAFEPNNDSAHATALTVGDTLSGCVTTSYGASQEPQWRFCPVNQMGCVQWQDSMAAYVDPDWFRIDVPQGKILNVTALPGLDSGKYCDQYKKPKLMLWNGAGTLLATNDIMMQSAVRADVRAGGRFYCSINYFDGQKPPAPHERAWYLAYKITAWTEDASSFALLSPAPGSGLTPGSAVTINWSAASSITSVGLSYCWDDSMKYWESMVYSVPNNGSFVWRVPYFKTAKPKVWIRLTAESLNLADTIDAPVSIAAADPDPFEPNDDSLHATKLTPGDTLKKCIAPGYGASQEPQWRFCPVNQMGCAQWQDSMAAYLDVDWFYIDATAGKNLTVEAIPGLDSGRYNDQYKKPKLTLLDGTGTVLATNDIMMSASVKTTVAKSGRLYCVVNYSTPNKPSAPHERAWYLSYGIIATFEDAGLFALTAPKPGAKFAAGEVVPVTWSVGSSITSVSLSYCWDDSLKYWEQVQYSMSNSGSYAWRVPYFKTAKPKVWLRIVASGINAADTIDGPVSIAATAPDAFEPNDDAAHAKAITFGDTLKGCISTGYGASQEPQWRFCPVNEMGCTQWKDSMTNYIDPDWYSFTVSKSKLVQVRAVPALDSGRFNDQYRSPKLTILDSVGAVIASNDVMMQNGMVRFNSLAGGPFFCVINMYSADKPQAPHERAWYFAYSLTAKIVADLEVLDVGPGSYVAKNGGYELALAANESNIDIALQTTKPAAGKISLATLPVDSEVVSLKDQGRGLTIISIEASDSIISAMKQATIGIPYSQSTVGSSEKLIEARYFNESKGEWEKISYSIDSASNTVNLSTTHFSIYGLFIGGTTAAAPVQRKTVSLVKTGIMKYRLCSDGTLLLQYGMVQAGNVRITAFGIDGKVYARIMNGEFVAPGLHSCRIPLTRAGRLAVLCAEFPGKNEVRLVKMVR